METKHIQAVVEIPIEELQTEKAKENWGDSYCCAICGKKLKEGVQYKMVHYLTNGNIISSDENFDNSQGFFPVGNECAKKLKINFAL